LFPLDANVLAKEIPPLFLEEYPVPGNPDKMNIALRASTGGLHSAEN
jgi:hypothetical protein